MTEPDLDARRFDPYRNFKFRVRWRGRYVAGVRAARALEGRGDVEHRDGGDPSRARKSPGRTAFEAITLERGVTHDADFEHWAGAGASRSAGQDLVIEVHDEAGRLAASYTVRRPWVSEYQAVPDLDAGAGAVTIVHMRVENEGVERRP